MIRKLVSKKDLEKKKKRNQYLLGSILIFILFGSVFGIIMSSFGTSSKSKKITYNGFPFLQENNYYVLKLGNAEFHFLNNPHAVAALNKEVNMSKTLKDLISKPLYIYSKDYTVSEEIGQNLNQYVQRIQPACLEGKECLENTWPIKTCKENFIFVNISQTNKIYEKDNCIFIEGKQEDLSKLTDEFLFRIIGIGR